MRKIVLSFAVIAVSGAYVWSQSGASPAEDMFDQTPLITDIKSDRLSLPHPTPTAPGRVPEIGSTPPPTAGKPAEIRAARPVFEEADEAMPVAAPPPARIATASPMLPSPPIADIPSVDIPIPRPRPERRQPATVQLIRRQQQTNGLLNRVAMTVDANPIYADGIYTGPVTDAYYGPVQLQALVQDGRLAGIKILRYPSDRRTSIRINRQALPMLRDEVISAQSARVDIVSGATLTSRAFMRSLAGALQQART